MEASVATVVMGHERLFAESIQATFSQDLVVEATAVAGDEETAVRLAKDLRPDAARSRWPFSRSIRWASSAVLDITTSEQSTS